MYKKIEIADLIESLRAEEGASIQIFYDNPDGPPNSVVTTDNCITGVHKRFTGNSLLECLRKAAGVTGPQVQPSNQINDTQLNNQNSVQ